VAGEAAGSRCCADAAEIAASSFLFFFLFGMEAKTSWQKQCVVLHVPYSISF
jgi:hypothetical protein